MLSLGVDIGGRHIAAGIFDFERKALIQNTYTHTRVNPKASKDQILSQWSATLQETIDPFIGLQYCIEQNIRIFGQIFGILFF